MITIDNPKAGENYKYRTKVQNSSLRLGVFARDRFLSVFLSKQSNRFKQLFNLIVLRCLTNLLCKNQNSTKTRENS